MSSSMEAGSNDGAVSVMCLRRLMDDSSPSTASSYLLRDRGWHSTWLARSKPGAERPLDSGWWAVICSLRGLRSWAIVTWCR
jgi:hypothetical protein